MIKVAGSIVVALGIGGLGGAIFQWIGTPLPWTLGSLAATAIAAILGNPCTLPPRMRAFVVPVVGVLAGSAFTPEVVASIPGWLDAILLVLACSAVVSGLGYVFFRIACGFDPSTSYFASAPGGLGEMALLGASVGANVRALVLAHSARIICVVMTVPFLLQWMLGTRLTGLPAPSQTNAAHDPKDWLILGACALAGYLLNRIVKIPAAAMVFALFVSALVHAGGLTEASPPRWTIALIQVVTGTILGARFGGIRWQEARKTVLAAASWSLILVITSIAFAAAGSWMLDRSFASLLLALAPGGMVEMTVITFALGIDVAFVVTCQVCRIVLVVTLAPAIFRLVSGKKLTSGQAPRTPPGDEKDPP